MINKENETRYTEIAKYRCERLAVYSNTSVKGTEKVLTILRDEKLDAIRVRVGNGTELYFYSRYNENNSEFHFEGASGKPQRWLVNERI